MTHEQPDDHRLRKDRRRRPTSPWSAYRLGGRRHGPRRESERSEPYFADLIDTSTFCLAVLLLLLTVVDGAATLVLLGAGCEEVNPAMDYLLRRGPLYFLLGKYVLTTACLPFLLTFRRFPLFRSRFRVGHLLPIFVVLYLVLLSYQISLITRPHDWSEPTTKTTPDPCPMFRLPGDQTPGRLAGPVDRPTSAHPGPLPQEAHRPTRFRCRRVSHDLECESLLSLCFAELAPQSKTRGMMDGERARSKLRRPEREQALALQGASPKKGRFVSRSRDRVKCGVASAYPWLGNSPPTPPARVRISDMREALDEFLAESVENLDRLDRDLVAIEANPGDRTALDAIFRTIHTLKGTCGFFNLPSLGALAHSGESLLARLRDGSIAWQPEVTTALLALNDALRLDLHAIEASGGSEGNADHSELRETLERLQRADVEEARPTPAVPPKSESSRPVSASRKSSAIALGQIRVDVELLDRLMDLVGELVLARNQLVRVAGSRKDPETSRISQRVNSITSALQEGVMKARMRPIGTVWDQFPRVVRDLARDCGKQVRLEISGGSTELDRTIIEAIKDPLTHVVRNAVDHGIEAPEVRRSRGKPETGRLELSASHEGGMVLVEIADDGGGIDPARVARKAIEAGLITSEQARLMGDDEIIRLIFQPGFSTAETVSSVSGRGVGLDVVRANIEAIGGTIEVQNRLGHGTTLAIKIPLTLAIIPTLIVIDGQGDRYAIPQSSLIELIILEGAEVRRRVEKIGDSAFYRFRNERFPLVDLDRILEGVELDPVGRPLVNIVTIQVDGRRFGLLVERIGDTEEIVVKPLGRLLRSIPLFAGATILGDGRVALILDVHGIARKAGLAPVAQASSREPEAPAKADERRSFLMLGLDGGRRLAVPLADVARLEEVPASAIARTSGLDMIHHRGKLLPLVRLGKPPCDNPADPSTIRVVVCDGEAGRSIGLVVDSILDVVKANPQVERAGEFFGLVGPALFLDQIADLVDVPALISSFALGA